MSEDLAEAWRNFIEPDPELAERQRQALLHKFDTAVFYGTEPMRAAKGASQ